MWFLCSFPHKLCFVPFGHIAIVFQNIRTLRGARCDVMMIQIVPMSPPLFLSPSEFIIRVVFWYFNLCHSNQKPPYFHKRGGKKIKNIILNQYLNRDIKYVPLQGFEPCFVPRLSKIKVEYSWPIPSDSRHQRHFHFRCLESGVNVATHFLIGIKPNS